MKNSNTIFLYPCSPLNSKTVEENYYEEYTTAKNAGLNTAILNLENISNFQHNYPENTIIVYRGWMLSSDEYTKLEQKFGTQLVTSQANYFFTHHLPNWYNDIQALTIRSIITTEEDAAQHIHSFSNKAFIKDYVKSLKTGKGSIVESEKDIQEAIANMKRYRGCIEGGIVLREKIDLIPNSEIRYFVIHHQIFSPIENQNKYQMAEKVTELLHYKNLPFYSIDIATMANGNEIVIEIGDGQVSDYVGWKIENFIAALKHLEQE